VPAIRHVDPHVAIAGQGQKRTGEQSVRAGSLAIVHAGMIPVDELWRLPLGALARVADRSCKQHTRLRPLAVRGTMVLS
jgi:hypothetical protein